MGVIGGGRDRAEVKMILVGCWSHFSLCSAPRQLTQTLRQKRQHRGRLALRMVHQWMWPNTFHPDLLTRMEAATDLNTCTSISCPLLQRLPLQRNQRAVSSGKYFTRRQRSFRMSE